MTFLRNAALKQRFFAGETRVHVEDARSTGVCF
jgi:hypothetical protein